MLAAVDDAFRVTGAATPGWRDPHLGTLEPAQDEYSRCVDPGKYRIVGARADAWAEALTRLRLAVAERPEDPVGVWRELPASAPTRAVRLRPHAPGGVSLVFGYRALHDAADALVQVGAGEPAVALSEWPDCGCDACDNGSQNLLEALDEQVATVVDGSLVHVTLPRGRAMTIGSGWSAGISGRVRLRRTNIERLFADARAGRSEYPSVVGGAWW